MSSCRSLEFDMMRLGNDELHGRRARDQWPELQLFSSEPCGCALAATTVHRGDKMAPIPLVRIQHEFESFSFLT